MGGRQHQRLFLHVGREFLEELGGRLRARHGHIAEALFNVRDPRLPRRLVGLQRRQSSIKLERLRQTAEALVGKREEDGRVKMLRIVDDDGCANFDDARIVAAFESLVSVGQGVGDLRRL